MMDFGFWEAALVDETAKIGMYVACGINNGGLKPFLQEEKPTRVYLFVTPDSERYICFYSTALPADEAPRIVRNAIYVAAEYHDWMDAV